MKKAFKRYPRAFGLIALWVVAILGGVAMPFVFYKDEIYPQSADSSEASKETTIQPVPGQLTKGTPTYKTLLPAGKTIEKLGGWTKVSPPNRAPVYAYVDTIGSIPIRVSQQQLPKDFAANTPEEIDRLAHAYAAETKLDVGDAIAYVGTSAKGPQSVIAVKNRVLILIKASAAIPNSEWEKYIKSLS